MSEELKPCGHESCDCRGYCKGAAPAVEPVQSAEPDWDSIREEAEHVTGLKVERNTYSIVVREVRKWLHSASMAQQSAEPVAWRAALLWVLWHHQGGSSPVGQPIRVALGIGEHEALTEAQVDEAKRWADTSGRSTSDFHAQRKPEPPTDEQIAAVVRQSALSRYPGWVDYGPGLGNSIEFARAVLRWRQPTGRGAWMTTQSWPTASTTRQSKATRTERTTLRIYLAKQPTPSNPRTARSRRCGQC